MRPIQGRVTADTDGDVVVFLIGMHVNRLRDVRAWAPVFRAMPRMLRELSKHPELGLLHYGLGWFFGGVGVIQYWESYEKLDAYARDRDAEHLPAWREFNRAARRTDSVGIYHETYRVPAGAAESLYNFMPEVGLLAATGTRRIDRRSTASRRLGVRPDDEAPVAAPD